MELNNLIFIIIGAIAGGLGGALTGITAGIGSKLAYDGKQKSWIYLSLYSSMGIGGLSILAGFWALYTGQPLFIWLALILIGAVLIYVSIGAIRNIKTILSKAQSNKLVNID